MAPTAGRGRSLAWSRAAVQKPRDRGPAIARSLVRPPDERDPPAPPSRGYEPGGETIWTPFTGARVCVPFPVPGFAVSVNEAEESCLKTT